MRRWLETHAVPLVNAVGEVDRLLGITRDITEGRLAEMSLRDSRTRLDLALQGAKMGIWHWDIKQNTRTFDEQVCRLLGLDPGTFGGTAEEFFGALHPEDRGRVRAALARTIDENAPYAPEYRAVWPDGTVRSIAARGELVLDDAGSPARLTGVVWDITEQKQRESDLREIAETLSTKTGDAYFHAMTEFIARSLGMEHVLLGELTGDHRKITTISRYWKGRHGENLTYSLDGTPCGNIAGKRFCTYASGTSRLFPQDAMLADLQIESYMGTPLFSKAGQPLGIVAALGTRALDAATVTRGEALLKIMAVRAAAELERQREDVLRRALEQQLLQSQKIESVGRLAGGIAHDINNMLTPMLGYADMLGFRMPANDPGRADLDEIISAANRVKDMTQQLLAFARKQTLDMRPLDVNMIITRFGKMLQRTLHENIKIALNLTPSVGSVLADERQLEQVILNLAVNAQDAMPQGGVLMISTKEVVVDRSFSESRQGLPPGRYLVVRIADTGVGMDKEALARLFEPFFTTKESGRGTGLGLATVYGIVKQHRGYIEVQSEPRQGATFLLYMPVTDDAAVGDRTDTQGAILRGSETIMVVEDQADVLRIVKQLLDTLGYQVLTAVDGNAALEVLRARSSPADLLMTDVIMPGMNGRELYEELRRTCPAVKVLYMSGYPADVISTHGVLEKGVHFLRKPFTVQDLSLKVREALDATEPAGS